jgi:hypothetical protein
LQLPCSFLNAAPNNTTLFAIMIPCRGNVVLPFCVLKSTLPNTVLNVHGNADAQLAWPVRTSGFVEIQQSAELYLPQCLLEQTPLQKAPLSMRLFSQPPLLQPVHPQPVHRSF